MHTTRLLLIQYLAPLVYAALFYVLIVLPNEATIWSTLFFLSGFYLGNLLLWSDGVFLYPVYNPLQTEPKQLITRSVVFMIAYLFLALFVITSSGNFIGIGMIFGIGITLFSELFSLRNDTALFHQRFLFQLKRQLSLIEIQRVVQIFAGYLLLVTIFFFF